MARNVLQDFLSDRSLLAIRLESRDLPGFFRKSFTVPHHATGLAFLADGSRRLLEGGRRLEGKFDLVLVKNGEFPVRFSVNGLKTADGRPSSATCEVRLSVAAESEEFLADFCRNLLPFPGTCSTADLQDHAASEVRRVLFEEVASLPAAEVRGITPEGKAGTRLREALERHFFDAGIRVEGVTEMAVACPRPTREGGNGSSGVMPEVMEGYLQEGIALSPGEMETTRAERIFAAAGSRVLEIDPAGAEPPRVYDFPLPLRSVRWAQTPRGELLLGGGRDRVAAIRPGPDGEQMEYPLPPGRHPRGGINAIACSGDFLFATHSEYGLARWAVGRPGAPAELLYPELTTPHRTTRAVQAVDGKILFATGPHVILAPADGAGAPVKYVSPGESPVTCAVAAARMIFAGTEGGAILAWNVDAPDQPVVIVRRRHPIRHLRLAWLRSIPHLVYTTGDLPIHARWIGREVEITYETGGPAVGAVDAAGDVLGAAEAGGRRILLWKVESPSSPWRRIDARRQVEKPVLDLWMRKIPRAGEGPHG